MNVNHCFPRLLRSLEVGTISFLQNVKNVLDLSRDMLFKIFLSAILHGYFVLANLSNECRVHSIFFFSYGFSSLCDASFIRLY